MTADEIVATLRLFEGECSDYLTLKTSEDGSLSIYIICNDVFAWALADQEEITSSDLDSLRKAKEDMAGLDAEYFWPYLFIARKRKWRPQGPFMKALPSDAVDLFTDSGEPIE